MSVPKGPLPFLSRVFRGSGSGEEWSCNPTFLVVVPVGDKALVGVKPLIPWRASALTVSGGFSKFSFFFL